MLKYSCYVPRITLKVFCCHAKIALWRNISASHSRNQLGMFLHYSVLCAPILVACLGQIWKISVTHRISGGNFCHPQTEIFLKTSSQWVQLDQSDCLLWSAYEVWPIRLFVLHTLWTFRVTQALMLHNSYLSIWSGHENDDQKRLYISRESANIWCAYSSGAAAAVLPFSLINLTATVSCWKGRKKSVSDRVVI